MGTESGEEGWGGSEERLEGVQAGPHVRTSSPLTSPAAEEGPSQRLCPPKQRYRFFSNPRFTSLTCRHFLLHTRPGGDFLYHHASMHGDTHRTPGVEELGLAPLRRCWQQHRAITQCADGPGITQLPAPAGECSAAAAGTRMPACSEPCWPSAPARRGWGCAKPARRRRAPQLRPSAWPLLLMGTGASRAHPHLLHHPAVGLSPWRHPQGEA